VKITRFADMGQGWEMSARAHYPGLFRVMHIEEIRKQYGMKVKADGKPLRDAGPAIWMGRSQTTPSIGQTAAAL
jgi:hypothetical protein